MVKAPSSDLSGRRPLLAAFAVLLFGGAVAVSLTGAPPGERATTAVVFGLIVGAPMLVGLAAWEVDRDNRFARLLVAAGAVFSLTALSQSDSATLYSVGRVAVWLVVPLLLYLMLTFPSGRLSSKWDRRLVVVIGVMAGTLYLPTALLAEYYPEPSPFARCGTACPANAFALVHVDAGLLDGIAAVREVILVLGVLAVAVSLAHRIRHSGPLLRRAMAPVLVAAVVQVIALAVYQWARRGGSVSAGVDVLGWVWLLTLPAVALSFAAGLLNRRLFAASTMQALTLSLRAPASTTELRVHLADALEDPSLRVVYWLPGEPGRWVDESGWPTRAPELEPGSVTEVRAAGQRVAAVIHDPALAPDTALVRAAASYALAVLDNTRLIEELKSSLLRLSDSESRTASAARGERKRIERDLHDGAQQRLVALRIHLALLTERLEDEAPERAAELAELAGQIDETIEDVRSLAHDPCPELLGQAGLEEALRVAAKDAPVHTQVVTAGIGRFVPEVEATVYFSCLEALQNAIKHAAGATRITIFLTGDDYLRFEVRDDGVGFEGASPSHGAGLTNIAERLAAVGGRLAIASAPGHGTSVAGTIPIRVRERLD